MVFLPLEILRQLIRPHGIATAHFGWPELVIKPLGQAVRRFGWIGLTLVFLATFLLLERYVHREVSALARIVFAILMLFIASTLWKLLGKKTGVVAGLEATQPDSLLAKLTWIWRPPPHCHSYFPCRTQSFGLCLRGWPIDHFAVSNYLACRCSIGPPRHR